MSFQANTTSSLPIWGLLPLCLVLSVASARGQTLPGVPAGVRPLTLDQALDLAVGASEQVAIARAGAERARAGERRAESEFRPQLDGVASYERTLASEFDGIFDGGADEEACNPLLANPSASLTERVAELERAYDCRPADGLFGDGDVDLPFGQANTWRVNLAFRQALYTGGRLSAQREQARALRESAELGISTAQAQAALQVAEAFLDAALSDRLVAIAQATLDQAGRAYEQTRAQREAGRQSEFDLLRAQVDRDTLYPQLVSRQATRRLAYLRLAQLLDLPLGTPVQAVTDLDAPELAAPSRWATAIADAERGEVQGPRVPLAQAQQDVRAREATVTQARAQRLPTVFVQSSYGLVNYSGAPAFDDFRDNWTVGATVAVPIFTGGRAKADEQAARASVVAAQQQLRLATEVADLDREAVREQLSAARAAWQATTGTVRQAERAFEIAELRYREGLSTQLELSDARLLLQQAQLNRATAARDLQLARIRAALLPDLPLGTGSAAGMGALAAQAWWPGAAAAGEQR